MYRYVPPPDPQILTYRAHAGVIVRFGKVVFAVVAAGEAGQHGIRIMAVVAVRQSANERRAIH